MIAGYETYEAAKQGFHWSDRWAIFGADRTSFNLAVQCLDRPISQGRNNEIAARIVHSTGLIETFTFAQLHEGSLRLATWLRNQGVQRGTPILAMVNPGFVWIVLHFAAFRIGAPILPSSPILGLDALRLRVSETNAKLIVALDASQEVDELARVTGVAVAYEKGVAAAAVDTRISPYMAIDARADDPAAFVFSSGTTGKPKKTVLTHGSYSFNAIAVGAFVLALNPADRFLKIGSTAWGGAFGWGVATPLLNGTAAGIYAGPLKPEVILSAVRSLELTALWCPPSGLRQLLKSDTTGVSLPKIGYAGEGAGAALVIEVRERLGAILRGHYGATEVGLLTLDYAYPDYEVRPGSLGQPLIGLDVAVLNDKEDRMPVEERGELAVQRSGKWYYTGDVGFCDKDGYYWLTGRRNDVIISGGYTIGPSEVEDCIRLVKGVRDVGVVGIPDADRGSVVKAFVELENGIEPSPELEGVIVQTVRDRVGRYAYPRHVEFVAELPRGEGGKVQRARLREQEGVAQ